MIEINKKQIRIWSMLGLGRTFGSVLENLMDEDDKLVLSISDTGKIIAYDSFKKKYPTRVMEVGIAEQNMISASAGVANEGYDVFASSYSTFITSRALDQIRVNMGMMQIPLKLVGIGGGLADGSLSATHMAIEDESNLRSVPGITVIVPADGLELVKTLFAVLHYDKPVYIKLTGENHSPIIYKDDFAFEIGKANELRSGEDIAILANGVILEKVLKAATKLEDDGISCSVIDMHTVTPIDEAMLHKIKNMKMIVTVEEHCVRGGLGSAVAEWYADKKESPVQITIGVDKDRYPLACEYDELLHECGLDVESIVNRIKNGFLSVID